MNNHFNNQVKSAKQKAVSLLARREYSQKEIMEKLSQKGFDRSVIDVTIESLICNDYLSDQRFTEAFIRSRISQGKGPNRVLSELKTKGIDLDINQLEIEQNEWINACRIAKEKKFGSALPQTEIEKNKQIKFLLYRGFTFDQVKCVISSDSTW